MKPTIPIPMALCLFALGTLTGCYTQLATRGYGSAESPTVEAVSASGAPASADSLSGDSALAQPGEADTLAPRTGTPTVIVNNYYDTGPAYRGYASWEWDFPALSFGYYSSRYGHYSRPYWWDDPWYVRRHSHGHHHHGHPHYRPSRPVSDGTLSGPYKSDKRLFHTEPEYPAVRKGRRSNQPPPAAPAQAEAVRQVAPKTSGDADGTATRQPANDSPPASTGGNSSGSSTSETKPAKDDSGKDGDYPRLNKGRRR